MPVQSFLILTNPEPWRVPPMSAGRNKKTGHLIAQSGRDQMLFSYQEEVRESMMSAGAYIMEPGYKIDLFFYRLQETINTGSGKRNKRSRADATNMQKAIEDALQGTVLHNDVDTIDIHSRVIPAGTMGDEPFVFIRVMGEREFEPGRDFETWFNEKTLTELMRGQQLEVEDDNTWTV